MPELEERAIKFKPRSKANMNKVDCLVGFITQALADEDIDVVFDAIFYKAKSLGYVIQGDIEVLREAVEKI